MKERFGQAIKAIVVEDEEKIGWYISNKIESLDASGPKWGGSIGPD